MVCKLFFVPNPLVIPEKVVDKRRREVITKRFAPQANVIKFMTFLENKLYDRNEILWPNIIA